MVKHRKPKGDWGSGGWGGGETEPPQICSTTGKRMYGSEEEARATAEHQMKKSTSVQLRIYRCLYCDAWHLTSKRA